MNILKQRRIISSIANLILLVAILLGKDLNTDEATLADNIEGLVIAITSLAGILLPLFSFFFPKK